MVKQQQNNPAPISRILLTVAEVAEFFRVHPKTVYRDPRRFGVRKIPGVGLRASWETVTRIANGKAKGLGK